MFILIVKLRKEKILISKFGMEVIIEAVNPPWDGGFLKRIKTISHGLVFCQGLGASLWWPCKDHQSDEPDSMRIKVAARYPLKCSKWRFKK